jgi:hypothetical protein
LKGKTLTVHLDPDNKLTLQEYTTDTYVNFIQESIGSDTAIRKMRIKHGPYGCLRSFVLPVCWAV